jgi:hypothetical protein
MSGKIVIISNYIELLQQAGDVRHLQEQPIEKRKSFESITK